MGTCEICKTEDSKVKKAIVIVLAALILMALFTGCNQANRVSNNISTSADNFQVLRRLTVVNLRTDTPLFELVGVFSLSDEVNRLVITVKTGDGVFKKHFISTGAGIFWDVEDLSGANVSSYRYELNILPKMFIPFDVVQKY